MKADNKITNLGEHVSNAIHCQYSSSPVAHGVFREFKTCSLNWQGKQILISFTTYLSAVASLLIDGKVSVALVISRD